MKTKFFLIVMLILLTFVNSNFNFFLMESDSEMSRMYNDINQKIQENTGSEDSFDEFVEYLDNSISAEEANNLSNVSDTESQNILNVQKQYHMVPETVLTPVLNTNSIFNELSDFILRYFNSFVISYNNIYTIKVLKNVYF